MQKLLRKKFGQFLRRKRGDRTLRDFAREAGLSSSSLQRLEQGEQNLTIDSLEAVLRKLKVSVKDVFPQ